MSRIKSTERSAIIDSLQSGLTPKIGINHFYVGRSKEIEQLEMNLNNLADGGSFVRFIIGNYGSGKTILLELAKLFAHKRRIVVASADISMDKILCNSNQNHKSRNLYAALINNLSTSAYPTGNALESIIQTWADNLRQQYPENTFEHRRIFQLLKPLHNHLQYSDFCHIIETYLNAYDNGDENVKENALRWLRGEFRLITEAKQCLNVRSIIDDKNWYSQLKLFADFVCLAGYKGLLVNIDEMAVLTRLNTRTRNANYERILEIINEVVPGNVSRIGFLFGGTKDFLQNRQKGLYSYDALRGRLEGNVFASDERPDYTGPAIFLQTLSKEEFRVLSENLRNVYAFNDESKFLLTDTECAAFVDWFFGRLGSEANSSPREFIKTFLGLLSQLENYPDTKIEDYLKGVQVKAEHEPRNNDVIDDEPEDSSSLNNDGDLFDFKNYRL